MFDLTMEDFDLLTDEEFEVLEQEVWSCRWPSPSSEERNPFRLLRLYV